VKVIGRINKFDNIVLYKNGIARKQTFADKILMKKVIGKSLGSSLDRGIKLVECFVSIRV